MITDNQNEIFDVVDANDNVIRQALRKEVHSDKSLIHRSVGIAVFNSNQKIFLQRRSITKDTDALLWTVSCSGHVLTGESYEDTAKREIKEELGIEGVILERLTKYLYKGIYETEMTTLYKTIFDGEIVLQKEEILEGKFFGKEELHVSVSAHEIEFNLYGKTALEKLGWINIS